jgi:hypothetical protein
MTALDHGSPDRWAMVGQRFHPPFRDRRRQDDLAERLQLPEPSFAGSGPFGLNLLKQCNGPSSAGDDDFFTLLCSTKIVSQKTLKIFHSLCGSLGTL